MNDDLQSRSARIRCAESQPMNPDLDRLLKDALRLPPEARGALAGRLIDSLDHEVDPDAEAAWDAEIARRDEEIRSGRVRPRPWAEARREIFRAP